MRNRGNQEFLGRLSVLMKRYINLIGEKLIIIDGIKNLIYSIGWLSLS
jgi:hypothetical protein